MTTNQNINGNSQEKVKELYCNAVKQTGGDDIFNKRGGTVHFEFYREGEQEPCCAFEGSFDADGYIAGRGTLYFSDGTSIDDDNWGWVDKEDGKTQCIDSHHGTYFGMVNRKSQPCGYGEFTYKDQRTGLQNTQRGVFRNDKYLGIRNQNNKVRRSTNSKHMKKWFGIILCVVLVLALSVFSAIRLGGDNKGETRNVTVKYGSKVLVNGSTTTVKVGDKIEIEATPAADVSKIWYKWGSNEKESVASHTYTLTIPSTAQIGQTYELMVNASYNDGLFMDNKDGDGTVSKVYHFTIEQPPIVAGKDLVVSHGSTALSNGSTTSVKVGDKIVVKATPTADVSKIWYKWDSDDVQSVDSYTYTFTIPSAAKIGETYSFKVNAIYKDDLYVDGKNAKSTVSEVYYFKITDRDVMVKYDSVELQSDSTTALKAGSEITLTASPAEDVKRIAYKWNDEKQQSIYSSTGAITIPDGINDMDQCRLRVNVEYNDGSILSGSTNAAKEFYFKKPEYLDGCQVAMTVTLDGKNLEDNTRYLVQGGEMVTVISQSSEADMAFVGYRFVADTTIGEITDVKGGTAEFVIPKMEPGKTLELHIEAVASNDDGSENTVTKTGWQKYTLEYFECVDEEKSIEVKLGGTTIENKSTTTVKSGDKIVINANPTDKASTIWYKWTSNTKQAVSAGTYTFTVPEDVKPGQTYSLMVNAVYRDGFYVDGKNANDTVSNVYYFNIAD